MNATERARRSDSLYYDTQVTNRRALCDRIANLESDLEQLQKEKVRLLRIVGECTSQLRSNPLGSKHGLAPYTLLDYIVMPMGAGQALCETVAEIVGKHYDMTDEGVKFDD